MNNPAGILLLSLLAGGMSPIAVSGKTQSAETGCLEVSSLNIAKTDSKMLVDILFDASSMKMKGNREIIYTPMLVNGGDTLLMPSFVVAGRNRYYSHLRNDNQEAVPVYRPEELTSPINYKFDAPFSPWMDTARLEVAAEECGCCSEPQGETVVPIANIDMTPKTFAPEYAYVSPEAEAVKMRKISARAYIDFPVNRTEIYPTYRRNPSELAKIRATIDSVRNDENLTITSIHIKGYASPEGSYSNNTRLAQGRTATLAGYVGGLYHFSPSTITTSYEPEDWKGLQEYVESQEAAQTLANREALLSLITDPAYDGDADARENNIKRKFPKDYQFLLKEIYPGLRHSDYDVNYTIRSYSDPKEIIEMMHTAPQNLSLQELYTAAKSQEPGSDIYNEAFEIAVRMYPEDAVANLNASCSAMQRNDLKSAERYLAKAGDSQEAQYARAILTAKQGDNAKALEMLSKLPKQPQAESASSQLKSIIENTGQNYTTVNDRIQL